MKTADEPATVWARLGDHAARLVGRRVAGKADLDDVIQEVLIRVWRHGGSLRDDERSGAWVSRVAHNAANDHLRDLQRQRLRHVAMPAALAAEGESSAEENDARKCITAALQPFIKALPPKYRDVLELSEIEELPHATIAQRLGLSVSGVKSRVQRGREQLRALLEGCCAIDLDARGTPVSCVRRPDGVLPPGGCAGTTKTSAVPGTLA